LGAALYSVGVPRDSAIAYETHVKANRFLVMACGSAEEAERARAVLKEFNPSHLDLHKARKRLISPIIPPRRRHVDGCSMFLGLFARAR
jgi:hypothetical protein